MVQEYVANTKNHQIQMAKLVTGVDVKQKVATMTSSSVNQQSEANLEMVTEERRDGITGKNVL